MVERRRISVEAAEVVAERLATIAEIRRWDATMVLASVVRSVSLEAGRGHVSCEGHVERRRHASGVRVAVNTVCELA
ncbi:hypothetical protein FHS02_002113 [Massilia umbonata]|uniref:Uncharacterized protein n=1 Tax=Pseudoduganella umbonata TaxID=864828 RepID=A0A7W5HBR4_9BURK|nr:hypothetical protein [Pseudoduganella umbonata]